MRECFGGIGLEYFEIVESISGEEGACGAAVLLKIRIRILDIFGLFFWSGRLLLNRD